MVDYAVETDLEVKNGPVWTQVEVTTFSSSKRVMTNEDIIRTEDIVWDVVERLRDPMEGPHKRPELPINFSGDITQRDIFCFKEDGRDIVSSCFIRHNEDFIGAKILWNFTQELKDEFEEKGGDISLRNVKVVAESWVEQHHPEIV